MELPSIQYSEPEDALYLHRRHGTVTHSVEISHDILLDIGEDGNVAGIEIHRATGNDHPPVDKNVANPDAVICVRE